MRFETTQNLRLSQQMKLAPRMIQSMEILQMPLAALQERIDQELESNVALEQADPSGEAEGDDWSDDDAISSRELVIDSDSGDGADDFERLSTMESNYSEAFDNEYESYSRGSQRDGERDGKIDAMANVAARQEGLNEQLQDQWRLCDVPADVLDAGERIINFIDADGMLSVDLDLILDQANAIPGIEIEMPLLKQALAEIQQRLDPAGVGARDRRECLLLQIDRFEHEGNADISLWEDVRLLIEEHYDDLLQNRLPRISQQTEMPLERINEAMAMMKKLSLSPGRDLVDEEQPHIRPDVIVEYNEQTDAYVARLADGTVPPLKLSNRYQNMARDRSVDRKTRDFVAGNIRQATWLIEAIAQRQSTLLRVVNVVLARQRDYFDYGPQHLKPLPMTEVAEQLGIHVATVSRAVSEKWLETPRGTVPLRKFFSGGRETDAGRDMSWEAVKATLREIIDAEDKTKPKSDESLATALKERGIEIARRTVVKYRQQMGIPSARQRKVHV